MNIPTAVNASLCSFRNNHTQIPFSPIAQPSWYVDRDVKIPVTTPYRSSISSTSQDIRHYLVISFISISVLIPIIGTGLFLSCIKNLIFSNDEFLQFLYARTIMFFVDALITPSTENTCRDIADGTDDLCADVTDCSDDRSPDIASRSPDTSCNITKRSARATNCLANST